MTQESEIEEIARAIWRLDVENLGYDAANETAVGNRNHLWEQRKRQYEQQARAAYEVMARSDGVRKIVHDKWLEWKAGEISADEALTRLFDLVVCPPLPDPPSSIRELPHD